MKFKKKDLDKIAKESSDLLGTIEEEIFPDDVAFRLFSIGFVAGLVMVAEGKSISRDYIINLYTLSKARTVLSKVFSNSNLSVTISDGGDDEGN